MNVATGFSARSCDEALIILLRQGRPLRDLGRTTYDREDTLLALSLPGRVRQLVGASAWGSLALLPAAVGSRRVRSVAPTRRPRCGR